MKWNEIGKGIRETTDGISDRFLGILKHFKPLDFKTAGKARSSESYCSEEHTQKILLENELKRSQAIIFARRFQNC